MAIDLFFYVTSRPDKTDELLKPIRYAHPELFSEKFIIYGARDVDDVAKEISLEHGLNACSTFMVSLSDKSAAALVLDVANILKSAFGCGNVIAMRGGVDGLI